MSQVDPRFLQARKQATLRNRRKTSGLSHALRAIGLGALVAAGVGGWMFWRSMALTPPGQDADMAEQARAIAPAAGQVVSEPAPDLAMAQPESAPPDPAPAPRGSIDLPGDPLLLQLGQSGGGAAPMALPRPQALPAARGAGDVLVVQVPLLEAGERLSLSLPTSPEDFAIFQAQRQRMTGTTRRGGAVLPVLRDGVLPRPATVAEARALLDQEGQMPGRLGAASLRLIPNHARMRPFSDSFLKLSRTTDLAGLLQLEGLSAPEASMVAVQAAETMGRDRLEAGQIVALRLAHAPGGETRFAQLAIYEGARYLGALGRSDAGEETGIDIASDPWLRQDLPALVDGTAREGVQGTASPRVMDALYAAFLRQGLSPGQVGQVIMLLAQTHKLDADATPEDRVTLVYSAMPGQAEAAQIVSDLDQVLYIALDTGSGTQVRCYVYRPGAERAPACYGPRRGSGPAAPVSAAGSASGGQRALTGSDAVEQLVNRIIQVESAGRAEARNPLSTATGLGQFIESTWLRMMRTYRPDLSATLSRAELLGLRTDPEISREMVLNLAREGESYLRARGHEITAGRLYLAHFLGMDGAHVALSAAPHEDLLTLFGAGVINANPFLRGRDAAYVLDWAERKMRGASGRIAVIREPDGLPEFRQMIDTLLTDL